MGTKFRPANQRFADPCIVSSISNFKHVEGSIVILGWFGGCGVGDLVKIDVILVKESYKEVLPHAFHLGII